MAEVLVTAVLPAALLNLLQDEYAVPSALVLTRPLPLRLCCHRLECSRLQSCPNALLLVLDAVPVSWSRHALVTCLPRYLLVPDIPLLFMCLLFTVTEKSLCVI